MIIDSLNESGFFVDFHNKIRKSLNENQLNEFFNLKNNIERIQYVNKLLDTKSKIPCEFWKEGVKNINIALEAKENGNKAFQIGDNQKALHHYSFSILQMPWSEKDCEALCILLANRSAALYHLEKHALAISDIDYLLSLGGYPKNIKYKVADRRARCLLALNQHLYARDAFRATLTALDDANLTLERRAKWQRDVMIMIAMMEKGAPGGKLMNAPYTPEGPVAPKVTGGAHAKFPNASAALHVEYAGPTEGRLTRAGRVINPGDVLVVEPPFVVALLPEQRGTHCWHCLGRLMAPLPCPRCCDVAFCSVKCQKSALTGHHLTECGFLPAFWKSGASITCLMTLRILSQETLDKFKSLKSKLPSNNDMEKIGTKEYCADNFTTFYQLVNHESERSVNDLLHRTLMSHFLLQGLIHGGYFGTQLEKKNGASKLSDDEAYIGSLLLHNLQVCQFNAHEVAELITTELSILDTGYQPDEKTRSTSLFVGGAVYPTLALFNHSCNPGVVRYFVGGSKVVARAIRGMNPGEEVCENYGPIYTREEKEIRQAKLKDQYWFDCHCDACEENWPLFESLPDMQQNTFRLKCGKCGAGIKVAMSEDTPMIAVACPICAHKTSVLASLAGLAETERKQQLATLKYDSGEIEDALQTYIEILKTLEKFLAFPPIKDYVQCQQSTRKCMLSLGNIINIKRGGTSKPK